MGIIRKEIYGKYYKQVRYRGIINLDYYYLEVGDGMEEHSATISVDEYPEFDRYNKFDLEKYEESLKAFSIEKAPLYQQVKSLMNNEFYSILLVLDQFYEMCVYKIGKGFICYLDDSDINIEEVMYNTKKYKGYKVIKYSEVEKC